MARFRIDTVYSPDDGGYYAEVVEQITGKTVYTTRIHKRERDAQIEARYWAEDAVLSR